MNGISRIGCLAAYLSLSVAAENLSWLTDANKTNLTSSGTAMDGAFRFELGVFTGSFVPTAANKSQWAQYWAPAQRTSYNAVTKRFSDIFTVTGNTAPFTVGADAYVWGFRGDPWSGEWILFRHASWDWPAPNPMNPLPTEWNAADATPVIGEIHSSGSPFLMKSAAVTNAAPPATSWEQWRQDHLSGEPLDEPGDDPDHDGASNLLEFVFGTPPKTAGAPTATPVALVGGQLQITIPRRSDHPAVLTVEVSPDLANWYSGASYTQTVSDGPAALVVRDLTPLDTAHPKRFIRLRASLP